MERLIKLSLSLALVPMLVACAIFPSAFDYNEHAKVADIVQLSQDSDICQNHSDAKQTSQIMFHRSDWLKIYGTTLPNNDKMVKMHANLYDMTKELADKMNNTESKPSVFYCREKIESINAAAKKILEVSGRRPRP